VRLFGQDLRLLATQIDASGRNDGWIILVGGDYQGNTQGAINAQTVLVNPATMLKADALTLGNGGRVVVWSDQQTALSNGNYVFGNSLATINGITGAGTVILANGTTGGEINRISGVNPGDSFGNLDITALTNGNYVFGSPLATINSNVSAGTVILANGTTGTEISLISGVNSRVLFRFKLAILALMVRKVQLQAVHLISILFNLCLLQLLKEILP
jgi:Repeat of unknown function (DUF5650)